jgi:membrane-bound lytic murein transglycosylase C
MKRIYYTIIILQLILFSGLNIYAKEMDLRTDYEIEWENFQANVQSRWREKKSEVEEKWREFIFSTQKEWVDYNSHKDARSKVDFKKGVIVLEAIVPEREPDKKAWQRISEHAEKIFREKDVAGKRVLENQVVSKKKGYSITPDNLKTYLKEEIFSKPKKMQHSFVSKDGLKRKKYRVQIDLAPDHIRVRAEKYLPIVTKNASRFKVNPKLILAIIHTESYFNPFAVSNCGAIGMMQIIPKFAGIEAYRFIYKKEKKVTAKYLHNPEKNIELGCAYLHILKYVYFKDVKGDIKNRYVSVCGYNWGPGAMRKKILNRYEVSAMTHGQVYQLLREKTPKETSDYIRKVTERISLYDFVQ